MIIRKVIHDHLLTRVAVFLPVTEMLINMVFMLKVAKVIMLTIVAKVIMLNLIII